MTMVHEAQGHGYCDTSGRKEDLKLVGEVNGVQVYMAHTIPDQPAMLKDQSAGAHVLSSRW